MIFSSFTMTSLNTFFSFFNMSANEFVERYHHLMMKYNVSDFEDSYGDINCDDVCEKYFLYDLHYDPNEEAKLSKNEEFICICTIRDLYELYLKYKPSLYHLSFDDFELYLNTYDEGKLQNFPINEFNLLCCINSFLKNDERTIHSDSIKSKFIYYAICIYYNINEKEYKYVK